MTTTAYDDKAYENKGDTNLNTLCAPDDYSGDGTKHPDPVVCDGVEVLFHSQQRRLIELINRSHTVVGCAAWLTDLAVLAALQGKQVCIIVQKEDFLRPDFNDNAWYKDKLQAAYNKLEGISRHQLNIGFSTGYGDDDEPAILCAGLANPKRKSAWPRMHHKFLLFRFNDMPATEDDIPRDEAAHPGCWPKLGKFDAVFTGSYNITKNASNSLENSLVITKQPIVDAYYAEFEHVFGMSEPLDWNSEWVSPRYRVGT